MFRILVATVVLAVAASAQSPPLNPEQRLVEALQRVQDDHLGYGFVDLYSYLSVIAQAHAIEAVPDIERLFLKRSDVEEQLVIASTLVRLGDTSPTFWNFLLIHATEALDSNPPLPFAANPTAEHPYSPEFLAWARARNLTPQSAYEQATFILPYNFSLFAQTGDPRALPLLRRALHSGNFLFNSVATSGLGKLNDVDSIPFILDYCANPQPMNLCMLATNLIYYDDPRAEQGLKKYLPDIYANPNRFRYYDPWLPEPKSPLPRPLATPPPEKP
jgi:hypothetical protein